jgi:Tol biopolymer transport system component/imidazolonepropionase-like amidohydrolase
MLRSRPLRSFGLPLITTLFLLAAGPALPVDDAAASRAQLLAQSGGGDQWDVSVPPFEFSEVAIDVTEGTWMAVDVSPDGREIAFDLLGDIYVMPIDGGEARQLTEGVAWNMQPRFSPNGQWIAFTSDRAGGDNVWVMDRDGSNPRQITRESFRLLSGPDWTPDSEYIVARKHFTSSRSLGAGEMWLYHRTGGGSGLQLTQRPDDQKDVNEPAFSPDGRYLYFSQDVTPGSTFQYNKDPNPGIYAIRRLDRETGGLVTLTGGPGGAIRPTPSPDGNLLAFIKRVRYDSHLFLRDLESGREWPIYGGMERDLQEIWAIHGVYPGMAWTPDGRSIVFWSGGKIRRIDAESGEVREIPFRVNTTRRMAEAHRVPIEVHPDSFDVKMLRNVQVSPQGDRVLFQALGYLWVRDLPNGEPRRLTTQSEHFEHYPSWSRDGRRVVYVSWHDQELAQVRVIDVDGTGESRVLVRGPGHFSEPVFSPDGRTVVYRKVSGGGLRSPLWSDDTGMYRIPAEGGEGVRFLGSGAGPQFGASNDRVYFTRGGSLFSIGLDGHDERQHLQGQFVSDIRVSPDERWVAWASRFHAYVRPLVPTGRSVSVSPGSRDVPQRRVTRDAGDWIHWSGNGEALHWALGPELFTLEVAEAFDWVDEDREEVDLPLSEGLHIGFRAASDRPDGAVAFEGARIITMVGDQVIENGTIVVEGNRIAAVGPAAEVQVPAGAHRVDASGMTIMPGMLDVHQHGGQGFGDVIPQQNRWNYATLAFGVTTIHNPSAGTSQILAASEMARAGEIVAPRIYSTGTILYGATSGNTAEVNSLEDARTHIRRMKAAGAISVKSYNQPRRDQRQQILQAAREEGIMVVLEGGALFHHNMNQVQDGHTGVEHSLPLTAVYDDVLQFWGASGTGYTPTLVVSFGGRYGENYWYQNTDVWENDRLQSFNPPLQVEARSRRREMIPDNEHEHIRTAAAARDLLEAGVLVNLGAHGQRNGLDAHWELWSFGQGGMTPHQALRVATLNGARYLGLDGDLGSLEPGKLADLIVLEANPLDDLRNSEHVRWTMVNGRLFDARTLNEAGNHPNERAPFYWEDWGWR